MSKRQFGLIGKNISYSFSKNYFSEKFNLEEIEDCIYSNFDIQSIEDFPSILIKNPELKGLNVTMPYKEIIIPYLDTLSDIAFTIGAVNVINIGKNGDLKGYNTDWYGFYHSLKPMLEIHHKKALIIGTGGASKAVEYALNLLNIDYKFVSRYPGLNNLEYHEVNENIFQDYHIIINCTPLGTFPETENYPPIPYSYFSENHIAYDLIYNPVETNFLKKARLKGAKTKNGYEMLLLQAEKSWEIWNK